MLQEKVKWPETERTIILIGTRGEVPNPHKNPRIPLVQPVPVGTVVVGYALHQALGLKVGDRIRLMGQDFTLHKCHERRGSKDDITVWISLGEAQSILKKPGLINAIMALECVCMGHIEPARIRGEIAKILPETQVVELGTKKLAREEARLKLKREAKELVEREARHRADLRAEWDRVSAVLVPIVVLACALWIGLLGFANVRDRQQEIAVLRAIGFRSTHVLRLFLLKSLGMGACGGILGFLVGLVSGNRLACRLEGPLVEIGGTKTLMDPALLVLTVLIASIIAVTAGWIPAMRAISHDPARILREE
jgi:putative ABC transport system permease protein